MPGNLQPPIGVHHLNGTQAFLAEAGTQRLVTLCEALETCAVARRHRAAAQAQGGGNVIGRALRFQLPEEPLALLCIGQRQRLLAGNGMIGGTSAGFSPGSRRIPAGPAARKALQADFDTEILANPRDQARRQQRVSAQFEEVVGKADPFDAQQLAPYRGHVFLQRARRRGRVVASGRHPASAAPDGPACHWTERHPLEEQQVRGHHVVR